MNPGATDTLEHGVSVFNVESESTLSVDTSLDLGSGSSLTLSPVSIFTADCVVASGAVLLILSLAAACTSSNVYSLMILNPGD